MCVVFTICEVGWDDIMRVLCVQIYEDSFGLDDILRFIVHKGLFANMPMLIMVISAI